MKLHRSAPVLLTLISVVVLLVPGIASLGGTPYGLMPVHLWLAALYACVTVWAMLILTINVLHHPHSLGRRVVLVGLLLAAFSLAVLLPFGAPVAGHYLFFDFSVGADWVLFNKYLSHLVSNAHNRYLWVISLCLVAAAIALKSLPLAADSATHRHEA
jgi:hypothetical protein